MRIVGEMGLMRPIQVGIKPQNICLNSLTPSNSLTPIIYNNLLNILREIRQMHVAFAHQCVVHGEGSSQAVAGLAHLGYL